jgi:polar amino acid transport system permease protein
MWYFLFLLVFYLVFTRVSEVVLNRVMLRLTRGQAIAGGEAQRKAAVGGAT